MPGGVMLVLAADAGVLEQLKRLADHRKEGLILEDDAPGLTLIFGPHHLEAHRARHAATPPHGFRAVHNTAKNELSLRADADNDLQHGYHTLLDLTAWLLGRVPQAAPVEALVWVERWPLPKDALGYADFRWTPARRAWELIDGDDPTV
jgi:hypothetical protein